MTRTINEEIILAAASTFGSDIKVEFNETLQSAQIFSISDPNMLIGYAEYSTSESSRNISLPNGTELTEVSDQLFLEIFEDIGSEPVKKLSLNVSSRSIEKIGQSDIIESTAIDSFRSFTAYDVTLNDFSDLLDESLSTFTSVNLVTSEWSGLDVGDSVTRYDLSNADNFIGSITVNGALVEVRDAQWNIVSRMLVGDGLSLDQIEARHSGFTAAWGKVSSDLGWAVEGVKFAFDDSNNIVVFNAVGTMLGRVSVWSGENRWSYDSDHDSVQISQNFSFNDADWSNLAQYDSWDRYVVEKGDMDWAPTDADVLREEYGVGLSKTVAITAGNAAVYDKWRAMLESALPSDETWAATDINLIRVWENSWTALPNEWRDDEETYTSERYDLLMATNDMPWGDFLGSITVNGALAEVRDAQWNVVDRVLASVGLNLDQIEARHSGFTAAWGKVSSDLGWAVEGVKFAFDESNNIVVFDAVGTMLGRVSVWSGENRWSRDSDYDSVHVSQNFSFNDEYWSNLAQYDSWDRYVVEKGDLDWAPTDADVLREEYGVGISKTVEITADNAATYDKWRTMLEKGLLSDESWAAADINLIRVWENSWTALPNEWRDDEETYESARYDLLMATNDMPWGDFLGSITVNGALAEVRDAQWTVVSRMLVGDGLSLDQIEAAHSGFTAAWDEVSSDLGWAVAGVKFAFDESDNIVVFDAVGTMLGRVSVWSGENRWSRDSDYDSVQVSQNFSFNDEYWSNLAQYDSWDRYVVEKGDMDWAPTDADVLREEYGVGLSKTVEITSDNAATYDKWRAMLESGLPSNESWAAADINLIRVWENSWTALPNEWRDDEETYTSERYDLLITTNDMPWGDFLGSITVNGALAEVRDAEWNVVAQVVVGETIKLDWLGTHTQVILDNWFEEFADEVFDLAGTSKLTVRQITDDQGVIIDEEGNIISFRVAVDEPDERGEVHWSLNLHEDGVDIAGWNYQDDLTSQTWDPRGGGVSLGIDVYPEDPFFVDLLKLYSPTTVDAPEGNVLSKLFEQTFKNDFDGQGVYTSFSQVRFIPKDADGNDDWSQPVRVQHKDGLAYVRDANGNTSVELIPGTLLVAPDWLGEHTQTILDLWFKAFAVDIEVLGENSDLTIMKTVDARGVLLGGSGQILSSLQFSKDPVNEQGQIYWSIYLDEGAEFGGWVLEDALSSNQWTDASYGLNFVYQIDLDSADTILDESWIGIVDEFGGIPEGLAGKLTTLHHSKWIEDHNGDGNFNVNRTLHFISDNDWDQRISVRKVDDFVSFTRMAQDTNAEIVRIDDSALQTEDGTDLDFNWIVGDGYLPYVHLLSSENVGLSLSSELNYITISAFTSLVDIDADQKADLFISTPYGNQEYFEGFSIGTGALVSRHWVDQVDDPSEFYSSFVVSSSNLADFIAKAIALMEPFDPDTEVFNVARGMLSEDFHMHIDSYVGLQTQEIGIVLYDGLGSRAQNRALEIEWVAEGGLDTYPVNEFLRIRMNGEEVVLDYDSDGTTSMYAKVFDELLPLWHL